MIKNKLHRSFSTTFLWICLAIFLLCLTACLSRFSFAGAQKNASAQPSTLHIAIPYSDKIQDLDSNYYVNWLERETGLTLEFSLIRQNRSEEYLDALFASDADVDIVMFGGEFTIDEDTLKKYIASGDIYTDAGGTSYYANRGSSVQDGAGQMLWINYEWLTALGLPIPRTTEELESVLRAFRENDPNGNGLQDELALVGAREDYACSPVEFILNAYVYNDPWHSRYGTDEEVNTLLAATDRFREGLIYLNELYSEGLLDERTYSCSRRELSELVNSPVGLVGAFTTASLSDVIYQANPEIMARYMHVAPLAGPTGERHAFYAPGTSSVGAVITARSNQKEYAALLLGTMCSEEASLIARYGEEGVDWDFSEGTDVSIYGGVSTIVTKNYIWNTSQNKHLNGIGPMNVPEEYLKGVTWNGINSDAEYIDGRAQMAYQEFLPDTKNFHEPNDALSAYMDAAIEDFITGKKEIRSDEAWNDYLYGLTQFQSKTP